MTRSTCGSIPWSRLGGRRERPVVPGRVGPAGRNFGAALAGLDAMPAACAPGSVGDVAGRCGRRSSMAALASTPRWPTWSGKRPSWSGRGAVGGEGRSRRSGAVHQNVLTTPFASWAGRATRGLAEDPLPPGILFTEARSARWPCRRWPSSEPPCDRRRDGDRGGARQRSWPRPASRWSRAGRGSTARTAGRSPPGEARRSPCRQRTRHHPSALQRRPVGRGRASWPPVCRGATQHAPAARGSPPATASLRHLPTWSSWSSRGIRSGSLLTVTEAGVRSVPVMAVPGSVRSPASEGTNLLLVDGATPVVGALDVLVVGLEAAVPASSTWRSPPAARTRRP